MSDMVTAGGVNACKWPGRPETVLQDKRDVFKNDHKNLIVAQKTDKAEMNATILIIFWLVKNSTQHVELYLTYILSINSSFRICKS